VTFGLLLGGVVISLLKTRGQQPAVVDQPPAHGTPQANAGHKE